MPETIEKSSSNLSNSINNLLTDKKLRFVYVGVSLLALCLVAGIVFKVVAKTAHSYNEMRNALKG